MWHRWWSIIIQVTTESSSGMTYQFLNTLSSCINCKRKRKEKLRDWEGERGCNESFKWQIIKWCWCCLPTDFNSFSFFFPSSQPCMFFAPPLQASVSPQKWRRTFKGFSSQFIKAIYFLFFFAFFSLHLRLNAASNEKISIPGAFHDLICKWILNVAFTHSDRCVSVVIFPSFLSASQWLWM